MVGRGLSTICWLCPACMVNEQGVQVTKDRGPPWLHPRARPARRNPNLWSMETGDGETGRCGFAYCGLTAFYIICEDK